MRVMTGSVGQIKILLTSRVELGGKVDREKKRKEMKEECLGKWKHEIGIKPD